MSYSQMWLFAHLSFRKANILNLGKQSEVVINIPNILCFMITENV